jgi:hypothetical protein
MAWRLKLPVPRLWMLMVAVAIVAAVLGTWARGRWSEHRKWATRHAEYHGRCEKELRDEAANAAKFLAILQSGRVKTQGLGATTS